MKHSFSTSDGPRNIYVGPKFLFKSKFNTHDKFTPVLNIRNGHKCCIWGLLCARGNYDKMAKITQKYLGINLFEIPHHKLKTKYET